MTVYIQTADDMEALGAQLTRDIKAPAIIFLEGDLGAGKTTLVRGFLRALGYTDTVKSPTYNIVESYEFADCCINHFDLYRLHDPEELEAMGFFDYFTESKISFIEWPAIAVPYLPAPDIYCTIKVLHQGRTVLVTRG